MKPDANIVLVGFMGTGKTTVGRLLAARLGRRFVDADDLIEERAGRKISAIFAEEGEAAFRAIERDVVRDLSVARDLVVAPGGGVVLDPANLADLGRSGLVVCLMASPEVILERVGHETHRPLLESGDKLQRIGELFARRRALYEAIPLRVDTDGLAAEAVADRVQQLFRAALASPA